MKHLNKEEISLSILLHLLFLFICIVILLPIILLTISSFRPGEDLMRYGLNFNIDPDAMSLRNYRLIFSGANNYFIWYKNSLILTALQLLFTLMLSACVGYGFSIYNFKFKNFLFACVLLVMMIPTEIILLPLYRLMTDFSLLDNRWGIILPYMVVPVLIFFFRQYLSGIPGDFVDAARIDGCTEYGIFARVMLPLMKPSLAAMAINQGMISWNNFLWPMIVLRSPENITLPVGLQSLMSPYGNNYSILIAGSVFSIIPVLILFVAFQKYFIEGLTAGAVKG